MTTQMSVRIKRYWSDGQQGFLATIAVPAGEGRVEARIIQRFGRTQYEAAHNALREVFAVEKESTLFWNADKGKPHFTHDCESCVYLGTFGREDFDPAEHSSIMDAYVCPQGGLPTVVCRYGDDGPDYASSKGLLDWLPAGLQPKAADLLFDLKEGTPA